MKKYNSIVVLGKFMPPHKGHEYLINFAKQYSDNVYVIVDCLKNQTIDTSLRKKWLEEGITNITVIALEEETPQDPCEHPHFWEFWRATILDAVKKVGGIVPEAIVASEKYGWDLAKALDCKYIMCDLEREIFPIRATDLRIDAFNNWDYLMDSVKPDYVKKICFIGPESTGKSTCAKNIAQHFNTVYNPEYAKSLIEQQNGNFYLDNVEQTAFAQIYKEKALSKFANKLLICDSDPLTTMIWSETLFNTCPESVKKLAIQSSYDVIFLFDYNTPYTIDIHRNLTKSHMEKIDQDRKDFFYKMKSHLDQMNKEYIVITGSYEQRFAQVKEYLNQCYQLDKPKLKLT
jgi:HTH-type transcriptional repressor of NAD biosynthesis genes